MDDEIEQQNALTVGDSLSLTDSLQVKTRTYFSMQHIQSAALFARECGKIEQSYSGTFDDALFAQHRAYVTGAVFAASAFLEASINEFFADAVDNPHGAVQSLDVALQRLLGDIWQRGVPRTASYPIPKKYQIALTLARKEPFDEGDSLFQNSNILVELRNALIHYEPEWIVALVDTAPAEVKPHKFEQRLRGKFALNPLTAAGNPFFPDKCLSHGCAEWAVLSAVRLTDAFYSMIGVPAPYEHLRNRLGTTQSETSEPSA